MAPSNQQLIAQLRSTIWHHLDNDLLSNALFLAGRLHALDPRNPEVIHILALCHQRSGQIKTAYDYAQPPARRGLHLGCAYVFAQACLSLHRPLEGIDAIEKVRSTWENRIDWLKPADPLIRAMPDAAAVNFLLGKLYEANDRPGKAAECYSFALSLNPFMWDAFERLADTGSMVKPANIFKLSPELATLISAQPELLTTSIHDDSHNVTGRPLQAYTANNSRFLVPVDVDPFSSESTNKDGPSPSGNGTFGFRPNSLKANGITGITSTIISGMETPPAPLETSIVPRRPNDPSRAPHNIEAPNAPMRKPRVGQSSNIEINADAARPKSLSTRNRTKSISEESHEQNHAPTVTHHKRTVSGSVSNVSAGTNNSDPSIRRSRRLFNQIRPNSFKPAPIPVELNEKDSLDHRKARATGVKGRSATSSNAVRVISGNRKPVAPELREAVSRENRSQSRTAAENKAAAEKTLARYGVPSVRNVEAVSWWLDVLAKLAIGYHSLSQYDSARALKSFRSLESAQLDTPWVLARIGKAYYEQSNFLEAEKVFSRIRKMIPSSVADMETYSTVLWHLKKDTDLAFLSHELVDADRLSPEAWCTIGNSFSLQREHGQALKCFRRATQLNPSFAYAHTLQGHEHMANEEYDKAMASYRRATTADKRHYNGWYGLGKVCEKEGKYDQAEKYYKAAVSINPKNAVLLCCIGVVMEKQKRPHDALHHYNLASVLQPSGSNSLYRKARLLLNLRRFNEALQVLEVLKTVAPDESNVHFMLGRTYQRMRNKALAIKHYTIAMNLDPKSAPFLKEQMEGLDDEDGMDDDDEDEEMT